MRSDVLVEHQPFFCVRQFLPTAVTTQKILVGTFKIITRTIFIELYVEEIEKYLEKNEKERECKRNVYLQKRKAQGLMTIEQVAEWAPQYSLEIQRTIRYIGMKIIDQNESVEKAHAILKVWGDALQTITSPKPSPPPTLK